MIKQEVGAVILGEKTGNCFGANAPRNDSVRKTFCHCEPKAKQSQAVACLPRIGEDGFSLVELIITMAVFVLVIAAASGVFTGLLTQFKQQSKIAETNIEGIVGLEILRRDIEHAGYGLPWLYPSALSNYQEATSTPASNYNDTASNPPRAIVSGNNVGTNNSDYLVIKSANVARNNACEKSTLVNSNNQVREWRLPNGNFDNQNRLETNDRVIVISLGTGTNERLLVVKNNGTFYTTYQRGTNPDSLGDADFAPSAATEVNIVYGISPEQSSGDPPETITPRMPFNRADYYISTSSPPSRCAPNTGVLEKATVNHNGGGLSNLPLLDCVADMQVDFWLDTDGNGSIDWPPQDDISGLTAQQIRNQLKEVRVYVVAQEGQRDVNYDFSMNNTKEFLSITEVFGVNSRTINFGNLKTLIGNPEYKYYRWKLYTVVAKPDNLR